MDSLDESSGMLISLSGFLRFLGHPVLLLCSRTGKNRSFRGCEVIAMYKAIISHTSPYCPCPAKHRQSAKSFSVSFAVDHAVYAVCQPSLKDPIAALPNAWRRAQPAEPQQAP